MILNMGKADRIVRLALAAALIFLTFGTELLSGAGVWVALAVAGVFTVTAWFGSCPLYRLFGLRTCRKP